MSEKTNRMRSVFKTIQSGLDEYRRTHIIPESLYFLYDQNGRFLENGDHARLAQTLGKTNLDPAELISTEDGNVILRTSYFMMNKHRSIEVPYHQIKGDFYAIFCPRVVAPVLRSIRGDAEILSKKIEMPQLEKVQNLVTTDLPELSLPSLKTANNILTAATRLLLPKLESITDNFSATAAEFVDIPNLRHIPHYPYTGNAQVNFHRDLQDYFQWELKTQQDANLRAEKMAKQMIRDLEGSTMEI